MGLMHGVIEGSSNSFPGCEKHLFRNPYLGHWPGNAIYGWTVHKY